MPTKDQLLYIKENTYDIYTDFGWFMDLIFIICY